MNRFDISHRDGAPLGHCTACNRVRYLAVVTEKSMPQGICTQCAREKTGWINTSPRGEDLPIGCKYGFSRGKPRWDEGDLPEGWSLAFYPNGDEAVVEAGFTTADQPPIVTPDGTVCVSAYLVNSDGELVATWDEGRWWTPEESEAWMLMLRVPATYAFAEVAREAQLPRWYRRRKRKQ